VRDLSHLEQDWYYVDSLFTYSQAGQRLFKAITSALSVSELGLEELSLGYFDDHAPSLIGIVQNLAPARLGIYQQAFGNLKRLKSTSEDVRTMRGNRGYVSLAIRNEKEC
jgi:hypothetical protein